MRQHFLSTSRPVLVGSVHRSIRPRTMSRSRTQSPGVTSAVDAESMPFRGTTRSRRWRRVSRGLYVPRIDSPTLAAELVAWRLILPPSPVFTCLTAAELRGWWLPATVEHPIFVAVPKSDAHPQRPGLLVTRHPRAIPAEEIDGPSVASAAETCSRPRDTSACWIWSSSATRRYDSRL